MENVCCTTQSRRKVQAQQLLKSTLKTTKHITLPPFPTTVVKGHTKLKGHDMRLNLIAKPSEINQLPPNVQCTPTYCNLEPGSNRVTVGLRNVSAKQITIPSRAVVCQVQLANTVPKIQTPKEQDSTEQRGEDNTWILDHSDLGELERWSGDQQQAAKYLLCGYSGIYSKNDLDLGKCKILKHDIKLTDHQPFKERYRRIPAHLFEELKQHLQEMVETGAIRKSFSLWASAVVLVRKKDGALGSVLTCTN